MTIQHMYIACWTHPEYGIILLFHSNVVYAIARQCYVYMYSILPVSLYTYKFNFVNCYLFIRTDFMHTKN